MCKVQEMEKEFSYLNQFLNILIFKFFRTLFPLISSLFTLFTQYYRPLKWKEYLKKIKDFKKFMGTRNVRMIQGLWWGYKECDEGTRGYEKCEGIRNENISTYSSHICCTSTIPMSSFACPCCNSQVAALIPLLHSPTTIINVQPLSLSISLPPTDLQPRVLKWGEIVLWSSRLIFWAVGFVGGLPRHWVVGLKLHFLSLGLIGLCSFGPSMIGLYWRLFGIFFMALDLCLLNVDPIGPSVWPS